MQTLCFRRVTALFALACALFAAAAGVRAQGEAGQTATPPLKFDFGPGRVREVAASPHLTPEGAREKND